MSVSRYCYNKKKFTRQEAKQKVAYQKSKFKTLRFGYYKCKKCDSYHTGHTSGRNKRKVSFNSA